MKIESKDRNHLGDSATMIEDCRFVVFADCIGRQQTRVVADRVCEFCFRYRLLRATTDSRNTHQRPRVLVQLLIQRFGNQLQHRLVQRMFRIADGELCRVDSDGESAGAGIDVVANQSTLMTLGPAAVVMECQRACGYHLPRIEKPAFGSVADHQ